MMRCALALLTIGCLGALVPAQTGENPTGLPGAPEVAPRVLVQQLGSDDYAVRAAATEKLRALGEIGRPALEEGSRSASLEISTRSRLLLDELDSRHPAGPSRSRGDPAGPDRLSPETPRPGAVPPLPPGLRELDELMERLRGQLDAGPTGGMVVEELLRDLNRPFLQVDSGATASKTRLIRGDEILVMERRPDGSVRFSVTPTPRPDVPPGPPLVYEAQNLTEFRVRFPEIYTRYEDTGLFSDSRGGFSIVFGRDGLKIPLTGGDPTLAEPEADAGVLQALVEPVPEVLRAHVAAIPERALLVSEVTPDGPGYRLGLRAFDVITRIDGRPVGDAAEVRQILGAPEPGAGAMIEIDIVRGGAARKLRGPRPQGR